MPKYRITFGKEGYGIEPLSLDDFSAEVLTVEGKWKPLNYIESLELIANAKTDEASFRMTQLSVSTEKPVFAKKE